MFLHPTYPYAIHQMNKSVQLLIKNEVKRQFANKTKIITGYYMAGKACANNNY